MPDSYTPRGIRNNNPGNIEFNKNTPWQGLDSPPTDGRFCRFKDATYGIRAIARTVITYQDKRRAADGSPIDTVQEIIERWAPPSENHTDGYVSRVCKGMGVHRHDVVDLHDFDTLYSLVVAIIQHENGTQPYTKAQITKGLVLAGVEPEKRPLTGSRTVKAGSVAGASGVVATGAGVLAAAAPALPVVQGLAETVQSNATGLLIVFGLLVIAAAGYTLYARWDDRRKGIA